MRTPFALLLCLFPFLAGCPGGSDDGNDTGADSPAAVCEPLGTTLDAAAWQADIQCAVQRIEENHPRPYGDVGEDEFREAVTSLENNTSSLEDAAIAAELMALVALVNDAHTFITVPAALLPHAPVAFRSFDDGVYALKVPIEHEDAAGGELVALNGLSVPDALAALGPLVPNETAAMRPYQAAELLDRPGLLWARQVSGEVDRAEGTIAGRSEPLPIDGTMNTSLVAVPDPAGAGVAPSFSGRDRNYRAETIPGLRLLYIQYNLCFQDPTYLMSALVDDVEDLLAAGNVDRILVDVRENPGGYDFLFDQMIEALRDVTVPVFVAIGPATYSSALQNAITLRDEAGATLIGNATTERANHFGGVRYFTLPNSGIRLSVSTRYIENDPDENGALEPDIELPRLGADYVNGIDPVLEWFETH